ncbi:MAG: pyridoxal 5'-phosphate synthase glutaminase subunit PdxT [Lentisphaeria bacterium]|nr:pyridoxal 5'-phosphate synthase glutaminase subunit PdxT [Lentisphaeria bacterium]
MRIGILALQGAFAEQENMVLRTEGTEPFLIRCAGDLQQKMDALILPGGESTVQGKLLRELELFAPLQQMIRQGLPVFATCAGLILLAEELADDPVKHFATLHVTVRRNAYGRQLGSFFTRGDFGEFHDVPMPFIRAPQIERAGDGVEILSRHEGAITAVRQKNQFGMAFHPELTGDLRIFRMFLEFAKENPLHF